METDKYKHLYVFHFANALLTDGFILSAQLLEVSLVYIVYRKDNTVNICTILTAMPLSLVKTRLILLKILC